MCMPKIRSLLCVDHKILNMGFFFHKQCGIFIPKRLPTSNSCCFKVNEAIELEQTVNGIFYLFCFRILLLIVLLPVHGQPVDD